MIFPGQKPSPFHNGPKAERYASGSVIARFEAKLVMDSRDSTASVRSQAFVGGWSRLYQAGSYYLDLSLKANGQSSILMGHVLPPVGEHHLKGAVRLGDKEAEIGAAGDFRFEIHPESLKQLEVQLETAHLVIPNLATPA